MFELQIFEVLNMLITNNFLKYFENSQKRFRQSVKIKCIPLCAMKYLKIEDAPALELKILNVKAVALAEHKLIPTIKINEEMKMKFLYVIRPLRV